MQSNILRELKIKRTVDALKERNPIALELLCSEEMFGYLMRKAFAMYKRKHPEVSDHELWFDLKSILCETLMNWDEDRLRSVTKYMTTMYLNNVFKCYRKKSIFYNEGRIRTRFYQANEGTESIFQYPSDKDDVAGSELLAFFSEEDVELYIQWAKRCRKALMEMSKKKGIDFLILQKKFKQLGKYLEVKYGVYFCL